MKHQTIEQLQIVAAVDQDYPRQAMSRSERLERWAELLECEPERLLVALSGTEYTPTEARNVMRVVDSPITVAFEDLDLRADGLTGDSYGEAKRFFEVTDRQLHDIVCHCHFGKTIRAASAARRVRAAIGIFARIRNAFIG